MMRNLLFIVLGIITMSTSWAQSWNATNLSTFNYLTVTATESHQSELYSILFNGFSGDVHQLDANGTSWSTVTISGTDGGINTLLQDANTRIYLTTNSLGYGMLYYSTDQLNTFVLDTVGLPKMLNGIVAPIKMQYYRGKVLANLGSSGYWLKDTSATTWQHIDVPTSLNGGVDPLCFYNDTIYAHDNTGANTLYVSGDFGQTWSIRNTNLPSFFKGHVLKANTSTGRLYMAGAKTDGTLYGIYYSDDNGFTWTIANLAAFIGTDVNGGQQEVVTIYANGNDVFIALENDTLNTTPDVLSSTNGIANVDYDTLGLIVDPAGTMNGAKFLVHDGKMAMALNVRDVYLKDLGTVVSQHTLFDDDFMLYPNPATDVVMVTSKEVAQIIILDLHGRTVLSSTNSRVDISSLSPGAYLVEVWSNNQQLMGRKKLVKH